MLDASFSLPVQPRTSDDEATASDWDDDEGEVVSEAEMEEAEELPCLDVSGNAVAIGDDVRNLTYGDIFKVDMISLFPSDAFSSGGPSYMLSEFNEDGEITAYKPVDDCMLASDPHSRWAGIWQHDDGNDTNSIAISSDGGYVVRNGARTWSPANGVAVSERVLRMTFAGVEIDGTLNEELDTIQWANGHEWFRRCRQGRPRAVTDAARLRALQVAAELTSR